MEVPGGPTATVIVTVTLADLLAGTGHGRTAHGDLISIPDLVELAVQAEVIPTFMSDTGAVLAQGRARRYATRPQTLALIARDGGCSFPGCAMPAAWCDRHHLVGWAEGGPTDVDNLTLLCQYHHYRVLEQGWTCHATLDGPVAWIPPGYIDPTRTPISTQPIRGAPR